MNLNNKYSTIYIHLDLVELYAQSYRFNSAQKE